MNRYIFAAILFFMLPNYFCSPCTCVGGLPSVQEEYERSYVIFTGKAISVNYFIVDSILPEFVVYKAEYKFFLKKEFKGVLMNDTISIITGIGSGDCGFKFTIGEDYIVYTKYENKFFASGETVKEYLYTDICTRTRKIDEVEIKELIKLNKKK